MQRPLIYLDNAATSFPKPEAVYRAVDKVLREISGNPGRASHRMALEASRVIYRAREATARVINLSDSGRLAFTKNATEAINIALKGLLKSADHVVTTSFEHNSVVKTLARMEKGGVSVTRVRPDGDGFVTASAVEAAITDATRMVCLSHASNVFGTIQPIAEIGAMCRRRGVLFMVDGAQTVGAAPVDIEAMSIDILAATGHKALFGPQGTGFLYVREGVEPAPLVDGGTGEIEVVLEMPDKQESGTMNTPGIGGLGAGAEFVLGEGIEKIRAHEVSLVKMIISGLEDIGRISIIGPRDAARRVSLVSFNIDGITPAEAGRRLDDDHGLLLRCGVHCAPEAHREANTHPDGAIRVSPGYFTTATDIERFLDGVRELAKRPV